MARKKIVESLTNRLQQAEIMLIEAKTEIIQWIIDRDANSALKWQDKVSEYLAESGDIS